MFNYNSYHKIITAVILIVWSIAHFSKKENNRSYTNGQPKKSGQLVNGKNQGLWVWYYEGGQKKMEGYFDKGQRNGKWTTFNKKGDTLSQSEYHNDQLNGTVTYWQNNRIINRKAYKNDILVE